MGHFPHFQQSIHDLCDELHVGVSKNRGTPKSSILIHFKRVFHYKPSILGAHPYFWKHPCGFKLKPTSVSAPFRGPSKVHMSWVTLRSCIHLEKSLAASDPRPYKFPFPILQGKISDFGESPIIGDARIFNRFQVECQKILADITVWISKQGQLSLI